MKKRDAPTPVRLTPENKRKVSVVMERFRLDNKNKTINLLIDKGYDIWFKKREDKKLHIKELLELWGISSSELRD